MAQKTSISNSIVRLNELDFFNDPNPQSTRKTLCDMTKSLNQNSSAQHHQFCQWILFLWGETYHCEQHFRFIQQVQKRLSTSTFGKGKNKTITVYPQNRVLAITTKQTQIKLQMHEAMIIMNKREIDQMITYIEMENHAGLRQFCNNLRKRPEFIEIVRFFQENSIQKREHDPQGKYFNLEEVFQRVNRDYFNEEIERPTLCWSKRAAKRTMGSYHTIKDLLTINCTLDEKNTPLEVIDFLMYHELLHKKIGIFTKNGRRVAHSPLFRKLENKFPRYAQIQEYLRKRF